MKLLIDTLESYNSEKITFISFGCQIELDDNDFLNICTLLTIKKYKPGIISFEII